MRVIGFINGADRGSGLALNEDQHVSHTKIVLSELPTAALSLFIGNFQISFFSVCLT